MKKPVQKGGKYPIKEHRTQGLGHRISATKAFLPLAEDEIRKKAGEHFLVFETNRKNRKIGKRGKNNCISKNIYNFLNGYEVLDGDLTRDEKLKIKGFYPR